MSGKMNKEQILHEMLDVLVKGWGPKAVQEALSTLTSRSSSKTENTRVEQPSYGAAKNSKALTLVLDLAISEERKTLLVEIAKAFDDGSAFPRTSDVRSFLAAHSIPAREIRSRDHAFRMMIPILEKMSEKGLARVISLSRHSGPADLGSISEAIKDTGNELRGSPADSSDEFD